MSIIKSKTLTLTGEEMCVSMPGYGMAVRNDGTETVYVSGEPDIVVGRDGVVSVPAGESVTISNRFGTMYLLGNGSVLVMAVGSEPNPFNSSALSSGSGVDEAARAAVNAHKTNTDIHITAKEREIWNAKADISDIPSSLPADGGNSDTINHKSASDFIYPHGLIENQDLNDIRYPFSGVALGCSNIPDSVNQWGTLLVVAGGTGSCIQFLAEAGVSGEMWVRHFDGSDWTPWRN